MKIPSKYIVSPVRTDKFREPSLSLSSSLSRRLRSNGSIKGGQSSPMFSITNRKKSCNFDTSEPSSPKVTCIGQVRVKTKKKQGKKKMRIKSKRSGEVGFSKEKQQGCLNNRNQRWVHIHLAISEALRAFSAELNCFFPCGGRSLCASSAGVEREKGEKKVVSSDTRGSCGEVFAKWLMVMQESEEEEKRERGEKREEEERVSVSIPPIPPRNALLLMRCRSDPLRMSSLANRFWDSPVEDDDNDQEQEEDEEELKEEEKLEGVSDETSEKYENPLTEEEQKGEERLESGFSAKTIEEHKNPQDEEEKEDETRTELQEREKEEDTTASSSSTVSSSTNALQDEEKSTDSEEKSTETCEEKKGAVLPDCLLLMMCEPKLSMEVSKETWVRRTDFLTWRRPENKDGVSVRGEGSYPAPPPPSNPAHPTSMATMIEQKLVNAAAYEPLVLSRCKSEPMRSSPNLLAPLPPPEICFWKSRKLHQLGVGAARIRF